jgi:hypothetical protein
LRRGTFNSRTPANIIPALVNPNPRSDAEVAAVVLMVTVVLPLPLTLAGLKLQVVSKGNPVHDAAEKFTVPLYPLCPVMVRLLVTLPPGLVTVTLEFPAENEKSASTVTKVGPEAELAKFESPEYCAVMLFCPVGKLDTFKVACPVSPLFVSSPPLTWPLPSCVLPLKKVTVPVGKLLTFV